MQEDVNRPEDLARFDMLLAGLDLLDQGVTVFDGDLRLVAWNAPFLRLLDFPAELAYVGAPFETFIRHNAERGEYGPGDMAAQIAERVAAARSFRPHVRERRRPNGRLLKIRGEPLPNRGFVTLYSDITEQRYIEDVIEHQNQQLEERVRRRTAQLENTNAKLVRANEERSRMQAALIQAQKMEAIGQLTGGLAHDFNNLLTVIIGNLATLRDQAPDDPRTEDCIDPALASARRGVQLIKRLLTFSRQQPLEPEPVDVPGLITGMSKLFKRSLPDNITLSTDLTITSIFTLADPGQLESAILNFVINARDAMPDGGRLHIATRAVELTGEAEAFQVNRGAYALIEVGDNGSGMDAETLARVFEPFFTTKRFGLGSGLGLSMAYGFARQSGGGIAIRSQPGQGTTVMLALPLIRRPDEADETEEAPPGEGAGNALVLLVEDDDAVRQVVRQQLIDLHHAVIEAASGAEALAMVRQIPDIAIVLSDIIMPGELNGRQLADAIRAEFPDKCVVLMTGYASDIDDTDLPWPVLAKPFMRPDLARALQRVRLEKSS